MTAATKPDRRHLRESVGVNAVLVAILLVLLPGTLSLSAQARRLPLWVIGVCLALLLVDLVRQLRALRAPVSAPAVGDTPTAGPVELDDDPLPVSGPNVGRRELLILGWLCLAGVGIYVVGYLVTVPVFLVAFFVVNRVPWRVWVPTTTAVWAVMYFGFSGYLGL